MAISSTQDLIKHMEQNLPYRGPVQYKFTSVLKSTLTHFRVPTDSGEPTVIVT